MRNLYRYADLAHLPADNVVSWPTHDRTTIPEGCDTRTTIMLRAMAQATDDALFGGDHADDRARPVDAPQRRVRKWEDD